VYYSSDTIATNVSPDSTVRVGACAVTVAPKVSIGRPRGLTLHDEEPTADDDVLGAPLACVSELRFPEPATGCAGTTYVLAAGGSLSTWQGQLLPAQRPGRAHRAGAI
jgi:hypothetical protein